MPNTTAASDDGAPPSKDITKCEEQLLHTMIEQGLTLRQVVAIFRQFTNYCRCRSQALRIDVSLERSK